MAANFKIMTEEDIKHSYKKFEYVNWKQETCYQLWDFDKPNEDKLWCRKCRGHFGTRTRNHSTRLRKKVCRKCNTTWIISVKQVPYSRLVWCSLIPLMLLGWGLLEQFSPWSAFRPLHPWQTDGPSAKPFYISSLISATIMFLMFIWPQVVARRVWLSWAIKRGHTNFSTSWFAAKSNKNSDKEQTPEQLDKIEEPETKTTRSKP